MTRHSVSSICRVLRAGRATYYRDRGPRPRHYLRQDDVRRSLAIPSTEDHNLAAFNEENSQ